MGVTGTGGLRLMDMRPGTEMICPECSGEAEFCKVCEGQGLVVVLTLRERGELQAQPVPMTAEQNHRDTRRGLRCRE